MADTSTLSKKTPMFERLQRFSRSLGFALFDRRLELEGRDVVYYYDTDVVYPMILGFESDPPGRRSLKTAKQRLVGALLSCHRLGDIQMLRPHALELDRWIRNQPKPTRQEDWETLRARVQQYLEEKGITKILTQLRGIALSNSGISDKERAESFLGVLREQGAETFTAIEQIHGTWRSRIRRYYDEGLLRFDHIGPNVQTLMESDRDLIFRILNILQRFRPYPRTANFYDSMALAILHKKLQNREMDSKAGAVRFYSHTRALNEAFDSDVELQGLLSHNASLFSDTALFPGRRISSELRSIIRDDDYFLTRLRFEELAPTRVSGNLSDLRDIERLYVDINQVVDDRSQTEIREALKAINWKGKSLLRILDEFEELALMDSIWVRHQLPEELIQSLIKQWTEVFHFAQSGEISESLDSKISDIEQELSSMVSQMRLWTEHFKLLQQGGRNTRKKIGAIRKDLEDPMRDLGLARWGYSLSEEWRERLVEDVKVLIQAGKGEEDQEELDVTCSQLASRMDTARGDVKECLYMSAILWAVGKFDSLVRLVDACEARRRQLPPTLVVLRAAAQLKALDVGIPKTKEERFAERKELVDKVWKLCDMLPKKERGGFLLGVGYVLYHAWKGESLDLELGKGDAKRAAEVRQWAQNSFDAGKEALETLGTGTLAWAFAVNHCAYVSLVTEVGSEEEREIYRTILVNLEGEPVWNSRFADTLGCCYLIPMVREWRAKSVVERQMLDFDSRIRRAEEYFEKAQKIDFGDIDLENHIERLKDLKHDYETARSQAGTRRAV